MNRSTVSGGLATSFINRLVWVVGSALIGAGASFRHLGLLHRKEAPDDAGAELRFGIF